MVLFPGHLTSLGCVRTEGAIGIFALCRGPQVWSGVQRVRRVRRVRLDVADLQSATGKGMERPGKEVFPIRDTALELQLVKRELPEHFSP